MRLPAHKVVTHYQAVCPRENGAPNANTCTKCQVGFPSEVRKHQVSGTLRVAQAVAVGSRGFSLMTTALAVDGCFLLHTTKSTSNWQNSSTFTHAGAACINIARTCVHAEFGLEASGMRLEVL